MSITLYVDVPITRRKFYHIVEDGEQEVIHRDRHISGALAFLDAQEIGEYTIAADFGRFRVRMERAPDDEGS